MRMLRALFMRIINWIRNVASTASRGLCNGEARRFAKPLDLLGRNAKTRWGEPAGLERNGHLAVTKFMEAPGIEPGSRGVFVTASTCVAVDLFLAVDPAHGRLSQTASPERFLGATVPGVSRTELNLATNFWASSAKPRSSGCRLVRQPEPSCCWQLLF